MLCECRLGGQMAAETAGSGSAPQPHECLNRDRYIQVMTETKGIIVE